MTHCVGIFYRTAAFYRDQTGITVRDIKSEWICHHSTRNNIRKNDTGLTGTMHYDIFPRITRFQTVLLHSILYISMYYTVTNGSSAFDTLQEPIPHITVYYT